MNYQLDFQAAEEVSFVVHVSADQQYLLWLDGELVGRGCEMKSPENWFFESYTLALGYGDHRLEALVWNYGGLSPDNRMSITAGLFLMPDAPHTGLLGTGLAPWKVRINRGITFHPVRKDLGAYISVPPCEVRDCMGFYRESGWSDWIAPVVVGPGINGALRKDAAVHCLIPSQNPLLHDAETGPGEVLFVSDKSEPAGFLPVECGNPAELERLKSALNREDMTVPPGREKRIIFRLDNYFCGYANVRVRGGRGARIRITWAEAGFTDPQLPTKSDRREVVGKYFRGVWDEFLLDGTARELTALAWRSGRFVELHVIAAEEAVVLEQFMIRESRYPLEPDGEFHCDQADINAIVPLCVRTLQVSAHDHFVDCPYYEQLPYTGDGRLEALVNLAAFPDDTLVRKMLVVFSKSIDLSGFTMAAWPRTVRAVLPSFSLSWIGMVHDYALWRDDRGLIVSLMPTIRFMLDNVLDGMDQAGFLRGVETAWNFIDWVDEWHQKECFHVPPGMDDGVNATYNWLFVYTLGLAQKLEDYAGDPFVSARWEKTAADLAHRLQSRFWDPDRGLFREDDPGQSFSEHAQIMAVLSGRLEERTQDRLKQSLFSEKGLAACSIYYKHYYFEACRVLNRPDAILSGLELWKTFIAQGFRTAPETPENKTFNQRSDCHGWGAHPFYHLLSSLAGIRPAEMGYKKVLIEPLMGTLSTIQARSVHPDGSITARYSRQGGQLECRITLPPNLRGEFRYGAFQRELHPGEQSFIAG